MNRLANLLLFCSVFLLALATPRITVLHAAPSPAGQDTVLKAADITAKLFPEKVFFRGQSAPVQMRNTAGVHFADDVYVLAGLVDSSGYSTAIKEKYQAYFLSEATLEIAGQTLKPGAYGMGFLNGNKFVVMDLGANDLINADSQKDTEMKRPMPLQIVAGASAGTYRLCAGRDFVEFHRSH